MKTVAEASDRAGQMRKAIVALTTLPLLSIVACGADSVPVELNTASPPAAASSPTTVPTAARESPGAAQIAEIAEKVFPAGLYGYEECERPGQVGLDFSSCPVTARLLARLRQGPTTSSASGALPFCRCQNLLPKREITTESTPTGGVAHVALGNAAIDLLMTIEGGRLLVDDTQCPGRGRATSFYADPVPRCA